MIKEEILKTQEKLAHLKERYKKLVDDIKKTFYEKKDFWDENSPIKPGTEAAMMQAALCLAQDECERYSFDLAIRKAENWISKNNIVQLDYWVVNQEKFKNNGTIPPTIVIRKKNIKILREICMSLWVYDVSESFRGTLLGFDDWLNEKSVDEILELMLDSKISDRIHLITDKNLYIKDIVVIFPRKPEYLGIF